MKKSGFSFLKRYLCNLCFSTQKTEWSAAFVLFKIKPKLFLFRLTSKLNVTLLANQPSSVKTGTDEDMIYGKATDLSTFLVQLRQLLLVFDSHLSHFLLQGITATRVSTRTETGTSTGQDTHSGTHSGTTRTPKAVRRCKDSIRTYLGSCALWTSYLSVWYLSDRTACRSDFSSRRLSVMQKESPHHQRWNRRERVSTGGLPSDSTNSLTRRRDAVDKRPSAGHVQDITSDNWGSCLNNACCGSQAHLVYENTAISNIRQTF